MGEMSDYGPCGGCYLPITPPPHIPCAINLFTSPLPLFLPIQIIFIFEDLGWVFISPYKFPFTTSVLINFKFLFSPWQRLHLFSLSLTSVISPCFVVFFGMKVIHTVLVQVDIKEDVSYKTRLRKRKADHLVALKNTMYFLFAICEFTLVGPDIILCVFDCSECISGERKSWFV